MRYKTGIAALAISAALPCAAAMAMGQRPAAPSPTQPAAAAPFPPVMQATHPPAALPPREAPPARSSPSHAAPQPKIVFKETRYGFGEVVGAEKIEHVFEFRNEGAGELRVDKVSTTCACTAALVSSKVIPPGGGGEIKTTFNVGGRQGKQVKHIYVYSNDPAEPKACLLIEGTIIPPLGVEPPIVVLQDTPAESARTVRISQTLPQGLELKEPAVRLGMVAARLSREAPENGRNRYSLEIALKPDLDRGRYVDKVTLETNCAAKPMIEIPVRITVNGEITASPSRISLGQMHPGQEVTRSVTLSSARGKEFAVLKAESDNPAFAIAPSAPLPPAKERTFTVTGRPSAEVAGVKATITFTLDHPKLRTIEVPIYGWMRIEHPPFPAPGAGAARPAPPPGAR